MRTEDLVARLDWADLGRQLDEEGHALLPGLLDERQVRELAALCDAPGVGRKVSLASQDLGDGEQFHFPAAPPALVADLRAGFYRQLLPIAHRWNDTLGLAQRYPDTLEACMARQREAGQTRAQSHLSRLNAGGYAALRQYNDGEWVFPLQLVALLSAPGEDFTGGEFVMTEQRPRMQSRPMVLPLRQGDAAVIAVAQRPHQGAKGPYRVQLRHAISRVRSGQRLGLELVFHDARPA